MHLEIIDQPRIDLLNRLKEIDIIKKFAIGGGTGVSLQLGLRSSYDFVFFINEHFNVQNLLQELNDKFKGQVEVVSVEGKLSTLDVFINKIKVGFFEYHHENLKPLIRFPEFKSLKLMSLEDIMCMKILAIIQRGTKKDFFDLYYLIKELKLNATNLLKLIDTKYHDENIKTSLLYSIAYFTDAEADVLPKAFVKYSWTEIKRFFITFQKELKKVL